MLSLTGFSCRPVNTAGLNTVELNAASVTARGHFEDTVLVIYSSSDQNCDSEDERAGQKRHEAAERERERESGISSMQELCVVRIFSHLIR